MRPLGLPGFSLCCAIGPGCGRAAARPIRIVFGSPAGILQNTVCRIEPRGRFVVTAEIRVGPQLLHQRSIARPNDLGRGGRVDMQDRVVVRKAW